MLFLLRRGKIVYGTPSYFQEGVIGHEERALNYAMGGLLIHSYVFLNYAHFMWVFQE